LQKKKKYSEEERREGKKTSNPHSLERKNILEGRASSKRTRKLGAKWRGYITKRERPFYKTLGGKGGEST